MGIAGWMARKGAVGGTARWAAKGYHALIRDNPDGTHFHLLMFLTETRYSSATDSPLKKRLIDFGVRCYILCSCNGHVTLFPTILAVIKI